MSPMWVVVADNARARLLVKEPGKNVLVEMEDLVHPEARKHERDRLTDKPGRAYDRGGAGRHAMDNKLSAGEQDAVTFANLIADKLEHARTQHEYQQLVLVSPPEFLGMLRKKLTDQCSKLVTKSIDKDLTLAEISRIEELVL